MPLSSSVFALILLFSLPAFCHASTGDELVFSAPAGFTEITDKESDLFTDTEQYAVRHGKLLKMYLPQYMAQQYRYGNRDAVTRQVIICTVNDQPRDLDQKDAEILARSYEAFFNGFSLIPRNRTDTPAQEMENRRKALENSLKTGSPLLVESLRTSHAYLYTCLIHHNMAESGPKSYLTVALACAVVPVKNTVLFITVSSFLGNDPPQPHLDFVKETAAKFSEQMARKNKADKR